MRLGLLLLALLLVPQAQAGNRLAQSDSPYLRMHAENPVDWFPWGDAAFEKARSENKPVFLSIGYSSCYWCRVAEETLYRDPDIAARMNAGFVNIKVDREQRPDLDRLYMNATRLLGGGGWPNNLFLTPERKPFFAGSYFPPADDDFGRPGFPRVMAWVGKAWESRRAETEARAEGVAQALRRPPALPAVPPALTFPRQAIEALLARADAEFGGLNSGGAAKFPQVPELTLLAGDARGKAVVKQALDAMAAGALRDHLGGGFHRYTVDPGWTTPHFEKLLYDNAQLLRLYAGGAAAQRAVARETAAFLLAAMQAPEGGFYASLDAVSAGREGAHYLWDEREIRAVLGKAADRFLTVYRVVPLPGHLDDPAEEFDRACGSLCERGALRLREGAGAVMKRPPPGELAAAREKLLRRRALRPLPARDEKIIVAWNGLAIEALAVAGEKLAEPRLTEAARKAAERLWTAAWEAEGGRLRQALFEGRPQGEAFLEDYALFGNGLLALAAATGERRWQRRAQDIAAAMLRHFDRADGGLAASRHEAELFAPAEETGDGPYPAGASAAWRLLDRLAGDAPGLRTRADRLFAALLPRVAPTPERWPALLAHLSANLSAVASAPAVDPSVGSAGVVAASARWQGQEQGQEGQGHLAVTLRIAPGWHVNANPASFDYLIPTALVFDGAQPRAVRYPRAERLRAAFASGEISVYAGTVVVAADFAGGRPAAARLRVQACSEEVCLPPAELAVLPQRRRDTLPP